MKDKPYCGDCPDREACHQGASCEFVRGAEAMFKQLDAVMTGKGNTIMTNTAKKTVADAHAEGAKSNDAVNQLIGEANLTDNAKKVPAQGEKIVTPDTEDDKDVDATEEEKYTLKDRLKTLTQKAKNNRQFFIGVVVGFAAASVTVAKLAKEKVEDAVELTVTDELPSEGNTDESTV